MNAATPPPPAEKSPLEQTREDVWQAMARNERVCFDMGYDAGFNAGWDAAMRRFTAAMENKPEPEPENAMRLPEHKGVADADLSAKDKVLALVKDKPGLRGVEIVEAVGLHERTVRTALHRLKTSGQIKTEDNKWYAVEGAANNPLMEYIDTPNAAE
jgi:hypothetical protein